jgi:hypothetical protein
MDCEEREEMLRERSTELEEDFVDGGRIEGAGVGFAIVAIDAAGEETFEACLL